MTYLQKKKLAFMSIVNQVKGFVRSVSGRLPLTLEGCVNRESITNYKIYGQSIQDGEPTPDNPIEVKSVGEYNESIGKYEIPVTVSSDGESITTKIYLDEPLRKVGAFADYIDFENGKVVRRVGETVIDSSINFYYSGYSTNNESIVFFYPINAGNANSEDDVLSNYFPTVEKDGCRVWRAASASNTAHFIKATNEIFGIDGAATTNDLKLNKIKAWLNTQNAVKPVLLYYVLKNPTETSITLPTIPTHKGTSIITVGTTIQPSQAEIEYYSNVKE